MTLAQGRKGLREILLSIFEYLKACVLRYSLYSMYFWDQWMEVLRWHILS